LSDIEVAPDSAPAVAPAQEAPESFSSASEAAAYLGRHAAEKRRSAQAASAVAAAPEDSPQGENSDPPLEAPAEQTQEAEPVEELPPIEPPRSWTKEDKEEFLTYPREAQEKIARREQDRETTLRRSQNEAAEQRKAIDAERKAAEQARQQYEQALPALLQTLTAKMQGEFSDVRTLADVQKLAAEDPFRFAQYQAKQMEIGAIQQEAKAAQERQAHEYNQSWSQWSQEQDKQFNESFPLAKDKAKFQTIMDTAVEGIKDLGFSEEDVNALWSGKNSVSLRDSRMQRIIAEWAQFRLAKQSASKPAPKPVPNVQRPGSAVNAPNRALAAQITALENKESISIKEATQLMALKAQKRSAA
jgi:hypothetical protein